MYKKLNKFNKKNLGFDPVNSNSKKKNMGFDPGNSNNKAENAVVDKDNLKIIKHIAVIGYAEIILYLFLLPKFTSLQSGTIASKSQRFAEILFYLKPPFILNSSGTTGPDSLAVYRKKGFRLFTISKDINERRRALERKNPQKCKEIRDLVLNYFNNLTVPIDIDPGLQPFKYFDKVTEVDKIRGRYVSLSYRQLFTYDTMMLCKGSFVTMVIDCSSRLIVGWCETKRPPNSGELIELFDTIFTPKLSNFIKIVHSDRAGANMSTEIIAYFKRKNIVPSFSEIKTGNQVSESVNRIIKWAIARNKFKSNKDYILYSDLSREDKMLMIQHCVEYYNNAHGSRSYMLAGSSRRELDDALNIIYELYANTDFDRNLIRVFRSDDDEGKFRISCLRCCVVMHSMIIIQYDIWKKRGLNITFLPDQRIKSVVRLFQNPPGDSTEVDTLDNSDKIKKTLANLKDRESKLRYAQAVLNGPRPELAIPYLTGLTELMYDEARSEPDLTPKEKKNLDLLYASFKVSQLQALDLNKKIDELNAQMEELKKSYADSTALQRAAYEKLAKDKEDLMARMQKTDDLITERDRVKAEKRRRKKINRTLQSNKRFAVMPEDFDIIMNIAQSSRTDYIKAKYILSHVILKVTGMRISNLKYFNIQQLDNLFKRKTVRIISIKSVLKRKLVYPYSRSMDRYINAGRWAYDYIKKMQEENDPRLFKVDRDNPNPEVNLLSEVWGGLNRQNFTRYLNRQLKLAGEVIKPNKRLTSHSYRRGLAILVALKQGIMQAKYLLGHASVTSTQAYLPEEADEKYLREILSDVHKIQNSKAKKEKKKYINYTTEESIERNDIVEEIVGPQRGRPSIKESDSEDLDEEFEDSDLSEGDLEESEDSDSIFDEKD